MIIIISKKLLTYILHDHSFKNLQKNTVETWTTQIWTALVQIQEKKIFSSGPFVAAYPGNQPTQRENSMFSFQSQFPNWRFPLEWKIPFPSTVCWICRCEGATAKLKVILRFSNTQGIGTPWYPTLFKGQPY